MSKPPPVRWHLPLAVAVLLAVAAVYSAEQSLPAFEALRASWSPSARAAAPLRKAADGASVVIIVLDAMRADHVGCYGYPRNTTPNIDRLAQESVVFENHFAQFTRTKESTASLFTSQYPDTHCAYRSRPLSQSSFTMAEGLGPAGFRTALFSSNPNASPAMELGIHFEEAYFDPQLRREIREGESPWQPPPLLRLFNRWLETARGSRSFAYLHLMPPHRPYDFPAETGALFADRTPPGFAAENYQPDENGSFMGPTLYMDPLPLPGWINLYDSNLRYGDWAMGQIVESLRAAGVLDSTLLIVTSDHGEGFGEHGFVQHGTGVHDEVSRIPLLIRFPGGGVSTRVRALTETVDLLPTIFDLFRVPYPPDRVQGRSLLGLMAGSTNPVHQYVFTRGAEYGDRYMVRGLDHALLLWGNGRPPSLYDLRTDPKQARNVIDQQPEIAEAMRAAFKEMAEQQTAPPLHFLDPNAEIPKLPLADEKRMGPEVKRTLRALGYLD